MRRASQRQTKNGRVRTLALLSVVVAGLSVGATVASSAGPGATLSAATTTVAPPPSERPDEGRLAVIGSAASDELSWPLRGEVTGRFGEHRGGHEHAGIDIPKPAGTPIRAASGGRVIMREDESGYGKYTCVAHTRISTCYAHQSRFRAKLGETVRRGEVIGYVGDTGTAYALHLHFEVRRGRKPWGKPLDPMKYLSRG